MVITFVTVEYSRTETSRKKRWNNQKNEQIFCKSTTEKCSQILAGLKIMLIKKVKVTHTLTAAAKRGMLENEQMRKCDEP